MKTADFIKKHCVGETCPNFDHRYGCRAYDGEECDEAFTHPRWHGLKMASRITMLCERQHQKEDPVRAITHKGGIDHEHQDNA